MVLQKQITGTLQAKLSRFLAAYRCTPLTSTGFASSELLFRRRLRDHLDLFHAKKSSKLRSGRKNPSEDLKMETVFQCEATAAQREVGYIVPLPKHWAEHTIKSRC